VCSSDLERWQKHKKSGERRAGNSTGDITYKSREQHERPRRRYTEGDAIEQLSVRQPVILRNRAALHENKRSVRAAEAQQSCLEKQPGNLEQARIAEWNQCTSSNKHQRQSWRIPFEHRRAALHDQVKNSGDQKNQQ